MTNAPPPFAFALTEADYVRVNQATCTKTNVRTILWVAGILLGLAAGVALTTRESFLWEPVIVGVGAGALVAMVSTLWIVPRRARAIYREQPSIRETKTVTVTDDDLTFAYASGNFRIRWVDLVLWREAAGCLMLGINRATSLLIPRQAISAETLVFIKDRLAAAGLPKPDKRRR